MKVVYFPLPLSPVVCFNPLFREMGFLVLVCRSPGSPSTHRSNFIKKWQENEKLKPQLYVFLKLAFTGKKEHYVEKGLK